MARVKIQLPEQVLFTHHLAVRTYDINKGGHLGHDRLISLLHEAREHFFFALGFNELDIDGVGIVVADLMVQYLGEAFMAQQLEITVSLANMGKKNIDMFYQVTCVESGTEIAKAKTAIVFFDYGERKAAPVPEKFIRQVEEQFSLSLNN